ncbi:MAG: Ig domain-containing protein [Dehalococcoidia bacterium]
MNSSTASKMKRLIMPAICLAIGLALLIIPAQMALGDAAPAVPNQFYGLVTVNGATAGSGVTVTASVGGVNVATGTTDAQGRYGYSPLFMVTANQGSTINFFVNGVQASQTASFSSGSVNNLPLTVSGSGTTTTTTTGTLTITTSSLNSGIVGSAYSQTIAASGGAGTYNFSILSGSGALPGGLTLGSSGTITGMPTASGTFTFTVQVSDSQAASYGKPFSLTVATASTSSATSITTSILGNNGSLSLTSGVLAAATNVASSDSRVTLVFAANTAMNLQGQTEIGAAAETNPPAATDNSTLLSAYSFSPSGAVFAPAATITLKYDVSSVPAGVSESSLYIAYWDGSTWQPLASTVDTTNKLVSASVSHFSIYAVRAPAASTTTTSTSTSSSSSSGSGSSSSSSTGSGTGSNANSSSSSATTPPDIPAPTPPSQTLASPPTFIATDLAVSPQTAKAGDQITVSLRLVNGGSGDVSKPVVLKVNDVNAGQQDVILSPGKSQVVTFKVSETNAGTYNVSVEGLSSSFQVQAGAASGNQSDNGASLPILGIILVGGLLVIVFVIILIIRQRGNSY